MSSFTYQQFIEALQTQNKILREEIIKSFCLNGLILISDAPNIHPTILKLNESMNQLNEQYSYKEMTFSNLGVEKIDGTFIYANNNFPLQNEQFMKNLIDIQEDQSPEILKRIEIDNAQSLLNSENEFSQLSRRFFNDFLKLLEEDTIDDNKQISISSAFSKSEIQKYKCVLQTCSENNQGVKKVQRYVSPDFGLGSLIQITSQNQDNYSYLIVLDTELNEERNIVLKESDIVITCGEYLSVLFHGMIKRPMYSVQLCSSQGERQLFHQQFFYPGLTFNEISLNKNASLPAQENTIKPNQHSSSKPIFQGMHLLQKKMQAGNWIKNHHNQIVGHQVQEYIQTLCSEELYPQIKVTELQFNSKYHQIRCFHFNLIDSTMNIAKQWKKAYVTDDQSFAFLADQQFKGQGQNKNTWLSPKGNCYVTFLVKFDPMLCYCLSQLTAVSVVETIDSYIPSENKEKRPILKWINDVFLNEKKISGVLCKVEDEYISIGIGVNLNHCPEEIQGSTSLKKELNQITDINILEFVQKLWGNLSNNLMKVKEQNSFHAILDKVEGRMLYINEKVKIFDLTLQNVLKEGIFRGLNEYGNAVLEDLNNPNQLEDIYEGRMRPHSFQ